MATPTELSRYLCEHYAYEWIMLRFAHSELHKQPGIVSEKLHWNAMLESCAVHARVLRDFYGNRSPSEDRTASEYGVQNAEPPRELKADFQATNKQIAHLDKNRPFGSDERKLTGERLGRIIAWLQGAHDSFIAKCDAPSKLGWNEKLVTLGDFGSTPLRLQDRHPTSTSPAMMFVAGSGIGKETK